MRSGSVRTIRWVSDGKYSATSRRLTTIFPVPGRSRTRATARLRRPVDWMSGLGIEILGGASDAGASLLESERLRLLGGMGMGGAGVDLELGQLRPTQPGLGQHAPDGA